MSERIIGFEAPMTLADRNGLLEQMELYPSISDVQHVVRYFGGNFNYQQANELLVTQEQNVNRQRVSHLLALRFHELVHIALPCLEDPFNYNDAEAWEVADLYNQILNEKRRRYDLQYSRRHNDVQSSGLQSPFDSLVSVRHIAKMTGVPAEKVMVCTKKPFSYGSLQLRLSIKNSNASVKKEAIHESVRGDHDRGRLAETSISGNIRRIQNERRMLSVTPLFISQPECR